MREINANIGKIYFDDNLRAMKFFKTKKEKRAVVLLSFVVPIIILLAFVYFLSLRGFDSLKVNFFFLFILLTLVSIPLIFDIIRSFKIAKDYELRKDNINVYINGKVLCKRSDLLHVFIQPVTGWKGMGETFTVGLKMKDKEKSLSFNNTSKDMAEEIAQEMATFFETTVMMQKKTIFSLYKGY